MGGGSSTTRYEEWDRNRQRYRDIALRCHDRFSYDLMVVFHGVFLCFCMVLIISAYSIHCLSSPFPPFIVVSSLGPVLFLIYINDISTSTSLNLWSFADGTTIYQSNYDIDNLTTQCKPRVKRNLQLVVCKQAMFKCQKDKILCL